MIPTLPDKLAAKLRAFLEARKTGSITLDVKNGHILAWKITEAGRLDKAEVDKLEKQGVD